MYLTEALEHVDIMNQALLKLEEQPDVKDHVDHCAYKLFECPGQGKKEGARR